MGKLEILVLAKMPSPGLSPQYDFWHRKAPETLPRLLYFPIRSMDAPRLMRIPRPQNRKCLCPQQAIPPPHRLFLPLSAAYPSPYSFYVFSCACP